MKNRQIIALGTLTGCLVLAFGGVAVAAPAAPSPIGGAGAHTHHIHTGNGGCVELDSVRFEAGPRGLHQAASKNIAHGTGNLFHGTCTSHTHS